MNEEGDWLAERILKTDKELSQAFNFDSEYPGIATLSTNFRTIYLICVQFSSRVPYAAQLVCSPNI
jgi:hypothetical protein